MHTSAAYMSIWWEHTSRQIETSDKKSIILQRKSPIQRMSESRTKDRSRNDSNKDDKWFFPHTFLYTYDEALASMRRFNRKRK